MPELAKLTKETMQKEEQARRWLAEHAEYIAAHNKSIEEEGLPLEQYRSF